MYQLPFSVVTVCTQATSGFKESNMLESWANVLGANRDNTDLVLELVQFGRIKSRAVAQTMRKVRLYDERCSNFSLVDWNLFS